MARPRIHAALTLAALGVSWHRLCWPERLALTLGGVFVDADHLVDLALHRLAGRRRWRVLPLHGWEYVGLLALAGGQSRWCRAARMTALGLLSHLVIDQLVNRPGHPAYFFVVFRMWHGFATERLPDGPGGGSWVHQPWWRWM